MSNIQESMLTEGNKDDVTDIVHEFYELAKQCGINIPQNYMRECIEDIMVFYEQYLKHFNSKFCSIGFYKIASWFCVIMATKIYKFNKDKKLEHNKNWKILVIIYVQYILGTLEDEGYVLKEPSYREKIMKMVVMEIKGKSDFGIGKNGLYMLVKMASIYSFQK